MPELPEVETIKRDLEQKIIGKKIVKIEIIQKKSIKNSPKKFTKIVEGNYIKSIKRKGKHLVFELKSNEQYLLVHLKMTGQLIYSSPKNEEIKNKHTRVIFFFQDRSRLYFNDVRRFGYLKIAARKEKDKILDNLGIDLLDKNLNVGKLKSLLKNRKRMLKSILLDQKIISGIGNIYVDEICFEAKLLPSRKVNALNNQEIEKLYQAINKIISGAIKYRGTTFSDYTDAKGEKGNFSQFLKVYGREKKKCQCCQKTLSKSKIAGRATKFCPNCQK